MVCLEFVVAAVAEEIEVVVDTAEHIPDLTLEDTDTELVWDTDKHNLAHNYLSDWSSHCCLQDCNSRAACYPGQVCTWHQGILACCILDTVVVATRDAVVDTAVVAAEEEGPYQV